MTNVKIIENVKDLDGVAINLACTEIQYDKICGLIALFGKENLTICGFDGFTHNGELCGNLCFDIETNNGVYLTVYDFQTYSCSDNENSQKTQFAFSVDTNGLVSYFVRVDYTEVAELVNDVAEEIKEKN